MAALLGLGASPALAQPYWAGERGYSRFAPYSNYDDGLPARAINRMLRVEGLAPVSPPARIGRNYVLHAADAYGAVKRVTIDARYGEIVAIQAVGRPAPQRFGYGRRERYDDGPWSDAPLRPRAGLTRPQDDRVVTPRPRARIPDADARGPDFRRDGELPAPPRIGAANPQDGDMRGTPAGKRGEPPKKEQTAVVAPAKPPLPRERPADLPQPAVAKPDAVKPDAAKPEATKPDATAAPEVAKPDAAKPEAAKPAARTATTSPPAAASPAAALPRVILPGGPAAKGEAPQGEATPNRSGTGAAPVNPLE